MSRPLDDPIDRQLAAALVADGRTTLRSLAETTGLSVSAVQARVRRLETDGVIRGYAALVEPEAIGLP
ncbi:MAG: Lrp/AsnC family transcriptional regulator, partial [Trebonia sp.]